MFVASGFGVCVCVSMSLWVYVSMLSTWFLLACMHCIWGGGGYMYVTWFLLACMHRCNPQQRCYHPCVWEREFVYLCMFARVYYTHTHTHTHTRIKYTYTTRVLNIHSYIHTNIYIQIYRYRYTHTHTHTHTHGTFFMGRGGRGHLFHQFGGAQAGGWRNQVQTVFEKRPKFSCFFF